MELFHTCLKFCAQNNINSDRLPKKLSNLIDNLSDPKSRDREIILFRFKLSFAINPDLLFNYFYDDKEIILKFFKIRHYALRYFNETSLSLIQDIDIVKLLLSHNICCYYRLSEYSYEIRDDEEIVLYFIKKNSNNFIYASERLRKLKKIAEAAVLSPFGDGIFLLPNIFKDDYQIAYLSVIKNVDNFEFVSLRLRHDKMFLLDCIKNVEDSTSWFDNTIDLDYTSKELQNDSDVLIAVLRHEYNMSEDYNDVLYSVLRHHGNNISEFSDMIDFEKYRTLDIVEKDGFDLKDVSDKMKDDYDVAIAAVSNYGEGIQYLSARLQNNFDVAYAAVKNNGVAYEFLSGDLLFNHDIITTAIKTYCVMDFMQKELFNDRELLLKIFNAQTKYGFEYLPDEMKDDAELILASIYEENYNDNYDTISDRLLDDRDFIVKFIEKDSQIFYYMSERLKLDKELWLMCLKRDKYIYDEIPKEFKNDEDIINCLSEKLKRYYKLL